MFCPLCNSESKKDYRPFCSKLCLSLDLRKWLTEDHVIAEASEEDNEGDFSEDSL